MIKHFIRFVIRLMRRMLLGPRLAPLADLSQGEVLNLLEVASSGYGSRAKNPAHASAEPDTYAVKEIADLKESVAKLVEKVAVLERTAK